MPDNTIHRHRRTRPHTETQTDQVQTPQRPADQGTGRVQEVTPELPTGNNIPSGPPTSNAQAGGNVGDVLTGGAELQPIARSSMHAKGPTTYIGKYKPSDEALEAWSLSKADYFGLVEVKTASGRSFEVRPNQYLVGNGKVGHEVMRVSDTDAAVMKETWDRVRQKLDLPADCRPQVMINFWHPEAVGSECNMNSPGKKVGDLKIIAGDGGGAKWFTTHTGSADGNGSRTHNSPRDYHNRVFRCNHGDGDYGYPCSVTIGRMKHADGTDVPLADLMGNLERAKYVMNRGVVFSQRDYSNDFVKTKDLNTLFMLFRDWNLYVAKKEGRITDAQLQAQGIDPAKLSYVVNTEFAQYCAENGNNYFNVHMNLEFSPEAFKELFGEQAGALVWDCYAGNLKAEAQECGVQLDPKGAAFKPLWKELGFSADRVRPFKDIDEWKAYEEARQAYSRQYLDRKLAGEKVDYDFQWTSPSGMTPLQPGESMPVAPQTTSDIIVEFIETFHSALDVSAVETALAALAFNDTTQERIGLDPAKYMGIAQPFIIELMKMEARCGTPADKLGAMFFGGIMQGKLPEGTNPAEAYPAALTGQLGPDAQKMAAYAKACTDPARAIVVPQPMNRLAAYAEMRKAIAPMIAEARLTGVSGADFVEYNLPPAIQMLVASGVHTNKPRAHYKGDGGLVKVEAIATFVDASQCAPNQA